MSDAPLQIADNIARIRQAIDDATVQSGRRPGSVTMVAVTKYAPPEAIPALIAAGCRDLGESRPQALWSKAAAHPGKPVRWHMIGHLQRNKIRRTLPLVSLLHSADSMRLLLALNEEAAQLGLRAAVLLEINISGDTEKHGFAPEEVESALASIGELPNVQVRGLMGMASRRGGQAAAERDFARLRQLRDRLSKVCPASISLAELSMGMSSDFAVAIREGATIVRIGSALFEGLAE